MCSDGLTFVCMLPAAPPLRSYFALLRNFFSLVMQHDILIEFRYSATQDRQLRRLALFLKGNSGVYIELFYLVELVSAVNPFFFIFDSRILRWSSSEIQLGLSHLRKILLNNRILQPAFRAWFVYKVSRSAMFTSFTETCFPFVLLFMQSRVHFFDSFRELV